MRARVYVLSSEKHAVDDSIWVKGGCVVRDWLPEILAVFLLFMFIKTTQCKNSLWIVIIQFVILLMGSLVDK